jgi:FkbM family methyltransferase
MILDEILKAGDTVFDIGANTGAKTELFLKYNVKVICIEPQEECLVELTNKFYGNGCVTIIPLALSSDGLPRMFRLANASTLSTFSEDFIERTKSKRFKNYEWNAPIEIRTSTIDNLIENYGIPNFCKIDVEGSEVEVLKGLSYPIPCISIEYTPELKENALTCMNILESIGRYTYKYSEGESLTFSNDTWLAKDDMSEYLYTNIPHIDFGDIYARLEV